MGGFWSKWNLALGAVQSDHIPILVVLLTSSLLNAGYFLPIVYEAFFAKGENFDDKTTMKEAPFFAVAPPVFTALASFVLFLYPGIFLDLARKTAEALLGG